MNDFRNRYFAIIGAGNIGRILIQRLLNKGVPADHIAICDSELSRREAAAAEFGVRSAALTDEMICSVSVLLLATPPKAVFDVLQTLRGQLHLGQLIISFAAAIPLKSLEERVPQGIPIVRVMPNAPSLVGRGMNPVVYGRSVTPEAQALVEAVLATLGETIVVDDEQMNWCVGLTGAAMRSILPVLEGMVQAGSEAGFPTSEARQIAGQVLLGTASLVLQTDLSFEELKALTPMETVDEPMLAQLFHNAACAAKEKVDQAQHKLIGRET